MIHQPKVKLQKIINNIYRERERESNHLFREREIENKMRKRSINIYIVISQTSNYPSHDI